MTTLHDRLADLAGDAPSGGPMPDLWNRGVRVHRVHRAGTLVIAAVAVLVLVSIVGVSWQRSQPHPTPADGAPALPDRIWSPSRWLPGTGEAGPPGQLAAVQYATRGTWGGETDGVVGISATSGEYRFLDLPDASENDVALAPDGHHVAYWYTGETRLSPNSESGPVVGVAVYDTSTGEVVRRAVPSDHGLMVGSLEDLAWADSERLVFSYARYRGGDADSSMDRGSGSDGPGLLLWEPGSDRPPTLLQGIDGRVESSTGQGQLLIRGGDGDLWTDVDAPAVAKRFPRLGGSMAGTLAIDEAGTVVAGPMGGRSPNAIRVVAVDDGSQGERREVPESGRTFAVRAWIDTHHVAADRRTGGGYTRASLYDVDVRTGESTEILSYPKGTYGTRTLLATDLLTAPAASRPAPPRPLDPRWVTGASVGTALLGLGALLLWRRRRVRA